MGRVIWEILILYPPPTPGEQNNINETVSENDDEDSDSVKSIRSDNSDLDQEEGEFQIHFSPMSTMMGMTHLSLK